MRKLVPAAVALCLGLGAAMPAFAKPTLAISVFGISQDAYQLDLYTPFEKICGCTVVVETGNSTERLAKLQANKAAPVIDVIAFSDANALQAAQEGLTAPLDPAKIPNLVHIYDFARDPVGGHMAVGYTFYGTSIVSLPSAGKITSWLDLFSPKLKGQVAFPNLTTTQGPIALYMIERALGKTDPNFTDAIDLVAKHKNDIVTFYEQGSQIPQLLQQGEIEAAVVGRFGWANLEKLNMPITWAAPKEGQTGGLDVLAMVKGTKQPALAQEFINYWLSATVQQKVADGMIDSPVNTQVKVSGKIADGLTYGANAQNIHFLPAADQLAHRDAWLSQWNRKVAN